MLSKANFCIISDEINNSVNNVLSTLLSSLEAEVKNVTYSQICADHNLLNFSYLIAILPQSCHQNPESLPLFKIMERLKSIVAAPKNSCLVYVQFGGGNFGHDSTNLNPEVCCAASFARSLHLERPDLKVRVFDFDSHINPDSIAQLIINELSNQEAISTVGYNANLERLTPKSQLQQPVNYTKRSLSWSHQDVILVTGGAKGITAECALALAEKTDVKMALVGSSSSDNQEVINTLKRFQAKGLTSRYYPCDITNAKAVSELVTTITTELGTVTGLIHGAGLNKPRKVEQVNLNDAVTEVSPKLLGAYNLLQVLGKTPPKLIMGFSSIIGVTGMPGNAWYAFANESLDIMLRGFQHQHPETEIISLAYSVWGEVGMGARLGSIKNLEHKGISAIPTDEGVSRFLKLFEYDAGVKQVVIAARLGGLDTWSPIALSHNTELRFIEQILYLEPGVELKARTHLSLERDLYIQDHLWRGSYLFPTVFGLEAMAQATAYVTGQAKPSLSRIENISLRKPVVVNPKTGVDIEFHAIVMEVDDKGEQRVKVGIRSEQTGFKTDHFSATLVLSQLTFGGKISQKLGQKLLLEPKNDLYGDLLFQGLRFQRMQSIFSLNEKHSVFGSYVLSEEELVKQSFAPNLGNSILLGDPYFRDVLLQSVQLTIPKHICLPVEIERIELWQNPKPDENSRLVIVELQKLEGQEYIAEVTATNEQGNVLEKITEYRLRILEEHLENPTAIELANPETRDELKLQKVLHDTFKKFALKSPAIALGYAPNLQEKSKKQRRQQERPIITRALKEQLKLTLEESIDFRIKTLASGKPEPELIGSNLNKLDLSLSHCDRYCLCVVDQTPQGCDIELITHRTEDDWVALLSFAHSSLMKELVENGDTLDQAGTRIWSALEAIRKAFNDVQPKLVIVAQKQESVLFKTETPAGEYLIVTTPIKLTRPPERMVAIVTPNVKQEIKVSESIVNKQDNHSTRYVQDGPQGQLVYEQRYQASFKNSGSISRHIHFAQYFQWIGKLRELPMESIGQTMLSDFLTGDWGMVTNAVSLRVLGEATAYDVIQGRVWVGNVVGSSFDTYLEFCKVLPDNSLERLAIAEVKATWVRLVSYGVPSPMPFPAYLEEYLEKFAAKTPATLNLRKPETLPLTLLPTSLFPLNTGEVIYQFPMELNRYGKLLRQEIFQTTLEESNVVGNVYYGNYFIWQGRILDLFLYSVTPEYLRVSNAHGEIVCLYTSMTYMREAMPFDKIRTLLYVKSVSECSAVFNFEFFRDYPDGSTEKLHVGQQEVAWVVHQPDGKPVAASWPPALLQVLTEQVGAFALN